MEYGGDDQEVPQKHTTIRKSHGLGNTLPYLI